MKRWTKKLSNSLTVRLSTAHVCNILYEYIIVQYRRGNTPPGTNHRTLATRQYLNKHKLPLLPPLIPTVTLFTPSCNLGSRSALLAVSRSQCRLLPQIDPDDILHTAPVMLRLPHIRQPGSPGPLLCSLHHLDALDEGTIDLVPDLDTHAGKLTTQQDRRIDAPAADVEAHAGKGLASALPHEENIADASTFRIRFGEETGALALGVEKRDLGCCHGGDGVRAGLLDGVALLRSREGFVWEVQCQRGGKPDSRLIQCDGQVAWELTPRPSDGWRWWW